MCTRDELQRVADVLADSPQDARQTIAEVRERVPHPSVASGALNTLEYALEHGDRGGVRVAVHRMVEGYRIDPRGLDPVA